MEKLIMSALTHVVTPVVRDSDNVTDTFVNGPINLNVMGQVATLTFTTVRPDSAQAFKGQVKDFSAVVTSRLTMPLETLVQLRELLSNSVQKQPPVPGSSLTQ
jgi:hypothetical protein